MPTFRTGKEAIQEAATRSGGSKFVPEIRWADKETKYVQFLQPIEEVTTVLMHPFVRVGERDNGTDVIAQFISRKDPALDGGEGYDPLIDRFGLTPTNRSIVLALELEAQGPARKPTGFKVARREFETRNGEKKDVPAVGLIVQSPFTFFSHLDAISDLQPIEDVVFAIKRTGASTDTSYNIMPVPGSQAIDLDEDVVEFLEEFDFDAHLEELADEERVHELIDPLADDWVVNRYQQKAKKPKSEGTASRRRRAAEEEVEPEAEPEPAAAPTRTRRFSELRAQLAAEKAEKAEKEKS